MHINSSTKYKNDMIKVHRVPDSLITIHHNAPEIEVIYHWYNHPSDKTNNSNIYYFLLL